MNISELQFVPTIRHDTYSLIDPTKSDLSGKYVFVTGASKGIGRAIALSYAKAGASGIAILARSDLDSLVKELASAAKEAGKKEPKVVTISADVTDRASIEAAAKKVADELGRLDIVINNAGFLEPWLPIHESDPDIWWKTLEINLKGVYLVTRSFLPLLLKGGDKTLINVSSIGAFIASPGGSAYQISKQAILRMTDHLTVEYGDQGLLVFTIHPGGVDTPLARGMPEYMHALLVDKVELAGDVLVFLTQEKRSWLNNRYLSVTWDMQELLDKREEIEKNDLLKLRLRV